MSKKLVGILLIVLVKKEHAPYIKDIRTDYAGIGIMGVMVWIYRQAQYGEAN